MKIHILHDFVGGAWGGGNQFLKALRQYLMENGLYADHYQSADTILVNSKDHLDFAFQLKKQFNCKIIHRIDGVFGIYRNDPRLDDMVHSFASKVADGVIFQSEWSQKTHKERGFIDTHPYETVIYNAANPNIFNTDYKKEKNKKIKLITTSWSSNWGKGFKTLQYLDEHLDFEKYDYEFIGQSPVKFKNIKMTSPLPQEVLVKIMKKCDIFITATENDTCSNSLLEALSCGLPAIGLNSGGTPELISTGGRIYNEMDELLGVIDDVSTNINSFKKKINIKSFEDIAEEYIKFISKSSHRTRWNK